MAYFRTQQDAVDWLRKTCLEVGYLIGAIDIDQLSNSPDVLEVIEYLGPPSMWGKYVDGAELHEPSQKTRLRSRPRFKRKRYSFYGYVKIARRLMRMCGGIPSYNDISRLLPKGPTYQTLYRQLGYKTNWKKYMGSEYDCVDDLEIVLPKTLREAK